MGVGKSNGAKGRGSKSCWRTPSQCASTTKGLAYGSDQIAHGRHIACIAGEGQAAELPPVLDGGEHRVVVIGHAGSACRVVRVRDGQRHHVTAPIARRRIAAAAGVAEPKGASAGEVAL